MKSMIRNLPVAVWLGPLFCAVFFCRAADSATFDTKIAPGNNYDQAQFRLWVPDNVETVRALLVLVPGSNGDGRDQVESESWRRLAEDQSLALVGLHLTDKRHDHMFIEHYVNVSAGSGAAFLTALEQLAALSDRPEIAEAPLLLWGMSAGGEFNYELALWRPDRVAAFVVNKGGIYYSALASDEARQVPGLFFTGEEDLAFRNDIIRGIFSINRRAHALWALVEQTGVGHAVAGSDNVAAIFFREILEARLQATGELRRLQLASGYYCDPASLNCEPASNTEEPREPVSWLANETLAQAWRDAQARQGSGE